jgi:uncharacterized protein
MEGAVRVFAGEFCQSTLVVPSGDPGMPGWVVTPGGAWCRQVYIAGALTEAVESADILRCRVADPTGAFDIVCGGRNAPVSQALRNIPVPSFVGILGTAQQSRRNGNLELFIRPEQVHLIDRACRDQFTLVTAENTLQRLEELCRDLAGTSTDERYLRVVRHYALTAPRILELAVMVEGAVQSVRLDDPQSGPGPDIRSAVMELLKQASGPRGIAVEEILGQLTIAGLRKEDVLAALESLIVDDECYQPQKGYVKLL